ncbi:unannotated protein [freshwater metagenome]|uniref:Unannotated protein n=1 Tax=freshwater metagenome TaxID=449393 RepID=A0A6J7PBB5_9ZZZZ
MANMILLFGVHDVERLKVVFGIYTEPCPSLALVFLGNIRRVSGQISNVADR